MRYELLPISIGANVFSGFAFKSSDLDDDYGIPIIKIGNINNRLVNYSLTQYLPTDKLNSKHNKYFLNDKDVLIAMTGQGSVGRVGRIRKSENVKILLNQRVGKFITDEVTINLDYLYFVLSTDNFRQILFDMVTYLKSISMMMKLNMRK